MTRAKILIVEDEAIIALEIKMHLTDFGYHVLGVAANAEEALQLANAQRPDLVLMDIFIKGSRDGVQTSQLLREQMDVPIVYLTGHGDAATLRRAVSAGSYGYLLKPYRPEELRAAIEVALAKHAVDQKLFARWREIAASLQTRNEGERSALAEQLHEQVAQELCAARYAISALAREEAERMQAVADILTRTTSRVTDLADDLRPAHITSGLLPALHKFAEELFQGEDLHWEIESDDLWIFEPLATPLFRVAEAALINIKLHSNARRVRIELRDRRDEVLLRISDDGRGFVASDADQVHAFGFARMQRWVESVGAKLTVRAQPGEVTIIEVRLPRA